MSLARKARRHWLLGVTAVALVVAAVAAFWPESASAGYWQWTCDPFGNCWRYWVVECHPTWGGYVCN